MAHDMTLEILTKVLPKRLKKSASQQWVDKINNIVSDPLVREAYRDNLLSYTSVIEDGRFQIGQYLNAVKYITHKLMGQSNIKAYIQTFPDRYQKFIDLETSTKDISSYVASYNKNKLVNMIREQTMIPTYVLNADLYQSAINTQGAIMIDAAVNARDRTAAANSLLQHLKAPEATKVELDVTVKKDQSIQDLQAAMTALAAKQLEAVNAGAVSVKQIVESKIVQSENI